MNEQNRTTPLVEESPVITRPKRRNWLALVLLLVASAALISPLLFHKAKPPAGPGGMGGPPGPPGMGGPNGATPIQTSSVTVEPMSVYIDALGTVTPERTASIYSQVSGRLMAVNYTEGQIVKEGQSLIEVDPRPYQALLDQARGALSRDKALLNQAQVNAKRYQDALARNAIAQQTLFDQQVSVQQYQGTLQNDEGSLNYYEVQLSYCHIVAPFTGRIGLRLVDPGNTIFSGSSNTLAVITQLDPITVVFSIAEDDIPQVQAQLRSTRSLKVDLYDRAQNTKIATGSLLTLDNQVDTTTGTVKFRARFRNGSGALFPNQFVNARLLVKTIPSALVLPTSVIQYNGQQAFVYVVASNNTVQIKNISVSNESDNKSAISGLPAQTVVAATNFDRLQDGAKVSVANPGATSTQGRQPGRLTGASH